MQPTVSRGLFQILCDCCRFETFATQPIFLKPPNRYKCSKYGHSKSDRHVARVLPISKAALCSNIHVVSRHHNLIEIDNVVHTNLRTTTMDHSILHSTSYICTHVYSILPTDTCAVPITKTIL